MADDKLMVTMIISIIDFFTGVAPDHCPRATDTQEPNTLTPGLKVVVMELTKIGSILMLEEEKCRRTLLKFVIFVSLISIYH